MPKTPDKNLLISPTQPSMLIDLKQYRIRIHRQTLHVLGEPEYIQFLINPEKNVVAIKSCNGDDFRSERIRWSVIHSHHCCEFYSKYLIKALQQISGQWNNQEKYYFFGQYLPGENLVLFFMNEYTLHDGNH